MSCYNFDPFDDYNSEFDEIAESDNPKPVKTVSMLRHYVNCHGITDDLLKRFNTDEDTVISICECCFGSMEVKTIVENPQLIDECEEERDAKAEARMKNEELVFQLSKKRGDFCGLGTRRIKLFLNKKIKEGDKVAEMYRLALETEDENIKAKDNWYYADAHYNRKRELIDKLVAVCSENDVVYGVQKSDVRDTTHIIYFELPDCEQISFHNSFDKVEKLPIYNKEWDKKRNSTLPKIEHAILAHYPDEIVALIEKYQKKDAKKFADK